jgi:predicted MPP superfamily phosphohydrolase
LFALRDAYSAEEDSSARTHQPDLKYRLIVALARLVGLRRVLAAGVETTRLELRIAHLPPALEGFCIAHVSDFHIGEGMWIPVDAPEAAHVVHAANVDVVVNTGDYLQEEPPLDRVEEIASAFLVRGSSSACGPANLSILGNHDYFVEDEMVDELTDRLEGIGVQVLVNRATCVQRDGRGISFVGLTDEVPGFEQGVADLLSSARPRVALIHEPELAERLPPGSADLVLAGHTHGGQITLPGLKPWITRQFAHSKYVEGLYQVNGMPVYVNRGIGCSGLPFRFRSRPEVALIRLVR